MTSADLNSDVVELGKRIRQARSELGVTREQFAPKLGVTLATVTRYETGRSKLGPSIPMILKIAALTGKPPSFFMLNENEAA